MFIKQLSQISGVTAKAIRYYESIGLLPPAARASNNYRVYSPDAAERLRFISAARGLDFSIADISEFLVAKDNGELPCNRVLDSLADRIKELDRRIADLLALRETLTEIHNEAQELPPEQACNERCVCYLLTVDRENGQITIQKENQS